MKSYFLDFWLNTLHFGYCKTGNFRNTGKMLKQKTNQQSNKYSFLLNQVVFFCTAGRLCFLCSELCVVFHHFNYQLKENVYSLLNVIIF